MKNNNLLTIILLCVGYCFQILERIVTSSYFQVLLSLLSLLSLIIVIIVNLPKAISIIKKLFKK